MRSLPRTSTKFAALVLALLAGLGLAAGLAEERTDVILAHLPAKESPGYRHCASSPLQPAARI